MKLIKFPISQFYVSQDMKNTFKKIILRCKLFINKRSEIMYDIAVDTVYFETIQFLIREKQLTGIIAIFYWLRADFCCF